MRAHSFAPPTHVLSGSIDYILDLYLHDVSIVRDAREKSGATKQI